ncbi:MAG: LD-carboxypeptidase [Clostridium butyricum]|nr:LD-carboxypeptidase [Clostridium butyricum]
MKRPKPLKKGDKIALIAPCGPVKQDRIEPAVKAIGELGLDVMLCESCTCSRGFLAGKSDKARADEINRMFADKSVKGIFAMRGGYGAGRILPMLDYSLIKGNPKVFAGYSDVTALHIVFNQKCGFVTFHGPMASTEFYKEVDPYTIDSFKRNIFSDCPLGVVENPNGENLKTLVKGNAQGILTGGNLSLLVSTIGTKYEINTKGKILFIEEIGEEPYRIDRMLLQLKQSGKFKDAAGIVLGQFVKCESCQPEKSLTLEEVFYDLICDENKPVLYNLSCGHSIPTMTLPMGGKVKIENGKFIIL